MGPEWEGTLNGIQKTNEIKTKVSIQPPLVNAGNIDGNRDTIFLLKGGQCGCSNGGPNSVSKKFFFKVTCLDLSA